MRKVVLDTMDAALDGDVRKRLGEFGLDRMSLGLIADPVEDQRQVRPLTQCVPDFLQKARAWIGVDGNRFDIGERGARLLEAVADGLRREPAQCLMRRNLSSSAAATIAPSRSRQAALSA